MVVSKRVLVTRPEPGASETAARLTRMGFSPIVLPLTRIVATRPEKLPDPATVDAVAVTSGNAIRHAPAGLLAGLLDKPVFAVGSATAAAARDAGFSTVHEGAGTAADLVEAIGSTTAHRARILHLAGVDRTEGFAEALAAKGHQIDVLEIYAAEEVSYPTDFVLEALGNQPVWGAPVFSTRGAELLATLLRQAAASQLFDKTSYFCISEKAAAPLNASGLRRVSVSQQPTEEAVLLLLSSHRPA
ncbi:uroporphyrinogen-III synthase [Mesorhizobium microcysteis]|uniref:Uroporphyrinogen-III synthase n=1 Tax=Neoaquamicrobium microcysteis TaxID=2682781 RepID=A0A5D4H0E9_9HYPH|nr:uroporphyrinogen-III synthase [Mesorhizobium microcysteis]